MDFGLRGGVGGEECVECEFDGLRDGFVGVKEGAVEVENGEGYHFEKGVVQLKVTELVIRKEQFGRSLSSYLMSSETTCFVLGWKKINLHVMVV